jgi:enamine deaminase RidA (YjgF/YER057c/UK114 family)
MIRRHARTPIMHRVVEHNGVLYFGGIVADDRSKGMKEQTADILEKIGKLLAENGSDKTKLLAATLYVTDMSQKDAMNEAWTAWFGPEDLPTRATLGVSELGPNTLIEVVVTAAR